MAARNPPPKPNALSVAYSPSLSRAVIAMVLAITASMMKITRNETMRTAMRIASVCLMNPIWNAFSVSVRVSAGEFLNSASIASLTCAARSTSVICTMKIPILLASAGVRALTVSFK